MDNIYQKLQKMRESIKKETISNFSDLVEVASKKAKSYKVLTLYSYYNNEAVLRIVDMDDIEDELIFKIPADLVNVKNAKEHLYKMAFDIDSFQETITPLQYINITEKMKEKQVDEKEILERYKIHSIAEMPVDIYKRCMAGLDKTKRQQS